MLSKAIVWILTWSIAFPIFSFTQTPTSTPIEELRADLIQRRNSLSRRISTNSLVLLISPPQSIKSNDIKYQYRQDSNLFYLTGIEQPDTILLLFGGEGENGKAFLFMQQPNPEEEVWSGRRLSVQLAQNISGISEVLWQSDFAKFMENILICDVAFLSQYGLTGHPFFNALSQNQAILYLDLKKTTGHSKLPRDFKGISCQDIVPLLANMRLRKSPYEIRCIESAVTITEEAMERTVRGMKPGRYEYELQADCEYIYKKHNSDWAFPSIIASGSNSTILHYTSNERRIQSQDLVLMDVGATYEYYAADISRTFPANGKFTAAQREIYNIVLEAQRAAIEQIKPGITLSHVHRRAAGVIAQRLCQLHLIVDVHTSQYQLYFMHATSHWLGLDVHDIAPNNQIVLAPGMVLTVEPGIYIGSHVPILAQKNFGEDFVRQITPHLAKYRDIGIRIEDDVLVTETGYRILTSKIPKSIPDIEKWIVKIRGK